MQTLHIIFDILYYVIFLLAIIFVVLKYIKAEPTSPKKSVKLNRRTVITIVAVAVGSRVILLLLSWGATHVFGHGRQLLDTWYHWDAHQYIGLANEGYYNAEHGWIRLVFYPLYSVAVWLFKFVFVDARLSAMLVSWACLAGACVYLYKLVLLNGDKKAANRAVKYLLIFPVTVFLGAPFTESMFLLLCFACLYYARIGKFLHACVLGALAALTRNVGVLLVVPVFIEMLMRHDIVPKRFKDIKNRVKSFLIDFRYILIISMGTMIYLLINYFTKGDALAFMEIQSEHWHQSFGSYANSLKTTLGQIFGDEILRNKLTLWVSQMVVLLVGGFTLPIICKKMRTSHSAYAIVYLFIVFAPTWLLSGFRYYMGLAVLFPALARLTRPKWVDITTTVFFALLMPVYTFCFSLQWQVF